MLSKPWIRPLLPLAARRPWTRQSSKPRPWRPVVTWCCYRQEEPVTTCIETSKSAGAISRARHWRYELRQRADVAGSPGRSSTRLPAAGEHDRTARAGHVDGLQRQLRGRPQRVQRRRVLPGSPTGLGERGRGGAAAGDARGLPPLAEDLAADHV